MLRELIGGRCSSIVLIVVCDTGGIVRASATGQTITLRDYQPVLSQKQGEESRTQMSLMSKSSSTSIFVASVTSASSSSLVSSIYSDFSLAACIASF